MAPPVPYLTRPSTQPPTGEPKNQAPFTRSLVPKTSGGEPKNQIPFTRSTKVTPTPRGTATGPHPGTGTTGKTQAELDQEQIDAWVRAAQLPQIQAIQAAQKAADDQAKANAASIQGYYQALAGLMANIGPATQQGYQQAAGADSAFGKGFSDGLAHIQSQMGSEATNALGISGAPASQQTEATQAIGGTGATDALYGAYGYIPATTMTREGAAFGAAANMLPASTAEQGAMQIKQLMDATTTKDDAFRQQLTDLAAQVPGLTLQYGQQLQSQHATAARDAFNQAMSIKKYNEQVIHDAATEHDRANALAYTKYLGSQRTAKDLRDYNRSVVTSDRTYNLEVQKANNATAAANAKMGGMDAAKSGKLGYAVDGYGNPIRNTDGSLHVLPGFKQTPQGIIKVSSGAGVGVGVGGGKAMSPTSVVSFLKGLSTGTRQIKKLDANGAVIKDPVTGTTQYTTTPIFRLQYQQAYSQLRQGGLTDVAARKALNTIYARGQAGRAWLTNDEQTILQQAAARKGKPGNAGLKGYQAQDILRVNLDPVSRHRYLAPVQYQILKAAGKLPPGAFQNTPVGKRYYVSQQL